MLLLDFNFFGYHFYSAFVGGEHGSEYLQSFSKFLQENYKEKPLDRIYLMVKQHMGKTSQVSDLVFSKEFEEKKRK